MIVANLSGGRDSTAMVIRWLELGNDLDYILFCDTGLEFKEMYEYIDKIDSYIQRNFNKQITRIDSSKEIEKWAFTIPITKGDKVGKLRGLPMRIGRDYCTREAKIRPTSRFIKDKCPNKFKVTALIGYTHNEVEKGRVSNLEYAIAKYPLHEWGWNEKEVSEYLSQKQIMNPLYNHFNRTGCFLCPKQSKASLFNLYKHYPQEWQAMKQWEARAKELNCHIQTFKEKPLTTIELEFKQALQQGELFPQEQAYTDQDTCFCSR